MPGMGIGGGMLGKMCGDRQLRRVSVVALMRSMLHAWRCVNGLSSPAAASSRFDDGYKARCQMVIRWVVLFLERACTHTVSADEALQPRTADVYCLRTLRGGGKGLMRVSDEI